MIPQIKSVLAIAGLLWTCSYGLQAQQKPTFSSDLTTEKKPWTNLDFYNDPNDFQFAIISDRTGSPRKGVFEEGIIKVNWLKPEFVMSIGDLIRGVRDDDREKLAKQWNKHMQRIAPLEMPFFHVAGNHDIEANDSYQVKYWEGLFGATFYSFVYRDVLFMVMFTNEGNQTLSQEQVTYFQKVVQENTDVRWTMLFLHHPLWRYPHASNFDKIEALVKDRNYTVFAGHQHRYNYTERNNSNYYVLATTGGGSGLEGNLFGAFDHLSWVTMTDKGPEVTNLRLDGILPHDVATDQSIKTGVDLLNSMHAEQEVFVDSETACTKGRATLWYTNKGNYPIRVNGRFFHNPLILPKANKIVLAIEPHKTSAFHFDFDVNKPFNLDENIQLELDLDFGYTDEELSDYNQSITQVIPIQKYKAGILKTRSVEFCNEMVWSLDDSFEEKEVYYTIDGSTPTKKSTKYIEPITFSKQATVKALLFNELGMASQVEEMVVKPVKPGKGLWCHYFEHHPKVDHRAVPDFKKVDPKKVFATKSLKPGDVADKQFGLIYRGAIQLEESGTYQFICSSDDGCQLIIDDQVVVEDMVKHKMRSTSGSIELEKGTHKIEITYYQYKRNMGLNIEVRTPSGKKFNLEDTNLSYN